MPYVITGASMFPWGEEWLRDNIFYLFIRFPLINKNRKCGWDQSIAPLVKKIKKRQPLAEALRNFLFLSVLVQRSEIFFHPLSLIYNCDFFFLLNWTDISVWHLAPFHTFSKYFLCSCVFGVQVQSTTGPPTSVMESQVLFTHLNEIHFDVTFERITSAWGNREEVSPLLCCWLRPTTAHLSFSDRH